MEKTVQALDGDNERLPQPRQTKLSAVLNGMGNGMMIGAIPFAAWQFYHQVIKNQHRDRTTMALAFATVLGAGIGAWYGGREARNLSDYRSQLSEELEQLNNKIARLEAKQGQSFAARATADETESVKSR